MIELTLDEIILAKHQCIYCRYWDKEHGCQEPTAEDPFPRIDCASKGTENGFSEDIV